MAGYGRDIHGALRVVAASPSRMAVGAALECDERSGDVATGVMPLGQRLVMLVKGADFEDLKQVRKLCAYAR